MEILAANIEELFVTQNSEMQLNALEKAMQLPKKNFRSAEEVEKRLDT